MLILFWPKSRPMCRNLQGYAITDAQRALKPAFLITLERVGGRRGPFQAAPPAGLNELLRVDINSLGTLDLSVSIALIIPVYISTTWIRRFNN